MMTREEIEKEYREELRSLTNRNMSEHHIALATQLHGERMEEQEKLLEGLRRFVAGQQLGVSSGVDGSITYGYGKLDAHGFWEFPVPEVLATMRRDLKVANGSLGRAEQMFRALEAERDALKAENEKLCTQINGLAIAYDQGIATVREHFEEIVDSQAQRIRELEAERARVRTLFGPEIDAHEAKYEAEVRRLKGEGELPVGGHPSWCIREHADHVGPCLRESR